MSERSKNKVLQIVSNRTPVDLPPQHWQIRYYDPQARYKSVEVWFEGGQMVRVHEPARLLQFLAPQAPKPLDLEKLKIDSDEALRIALSLPAINDLIVRSAEFELERGYGGSPVWKVQLFGATASQSPEETGLGYAIIFADDGRVLKETLSKKQLRTK